VGIDLEQMTHRISRIAHYFIHPEEKITEDETKKRYHLYIHWCAKEALFKICDKNALNFRKHMFIEPFDPAVEGDIRGRVDNGKIQLTFDLHYRRMKDYVMVWCCK
jgi:4'-phosphopantetheinyl transferase EntD